MSMMFAAVDPRTGQSGPAMTETTPEELEALVREAKDAANEPSLADASRRAQMLRGIARRLRDREHEIVGVATSESGLPSARLRGELERTVVQLEMFAEVIEAGEHLDVIIDHGDPQAPPAPRPDLRRMLIALGPVAVFGASNFPLAFSTAGGDTASALAAGCPVVVKGHPAHPGTGSLVAEQIREAVHDTGLPPGTFGHVLAGGNTLGELLVDDDRIEAVVFTGSLHGGLALAARAAARPRPIPVFAEMGSLNPLIVTQGALRARGQAIADGLVASVADFGGQLCTKPGIVLFPNGQSGADFCDAVAARLNERQPEVLLTEPIASAFANGLTELDRLPGVQRLVAAGSVRGEIGFRAQPTAYRAGVSLLREHPALRDEHFGPAVLLLSYTDDTALAAGLEALGGQLSVSLHAEPSEHQDLQWLVALCANRCGRLVFDGYPTGVSVGWAMQHGGPYPATTDSRWTSVGMTATQRFLRPVVYQNSPASLLPDALKDGNPLGIRRRVNGLFTRDAAPAPGVIGARERQPDDNPIPRR